MRRHARAPRPGVRGPLRPPAGRPGTRAFLRGEEGAVTVDWVVLTAALVVLGVGVIAVLDTAVANVSADIAEDMAGRLGASYSADGGGEEGGG